MKIAQWDPRLKLGVRLCIILRLIDTFKGGS
jgi:hypothetical protein